MGRKNPRQRAARNQVINSGEKSIRKSSTLSGNYLVGGKFLKRLLSKTCCGEEMSRKNDSTSRLCETDLRLSAVSSSGFATDFELSCRHGHQSEVLHSSEEADTGSVHREAQEINVRVILNSLLKGEKFDEMNETLAGIVGTTIGYPSYKKIRDRIYGKVHMLAETSRREAIAFLKQRYGNNVTIAMDGSWSKRYGHNANFGVVVAIHPETRKVIGIALYSKYCHICKWHEGQNKPVPEHNCQKNWTASSGAMEASGFADLGRQLLDEDDLRFDHVLADGDSKGFDALCDAVKSVYRPRKLNDKSHFAKRFESRIKTIKANLGKRTKLADGKPLTGPGRLTEKVVTDLKVQIGANLVHHISSKSSPQDVKKWMFAPLYHKMSTDESPRHEDGCDIYFCRYLQATSEGKEHLHDPKKTVPAACMEAIKPAFEDLSSTELCLSLCHDGNTDLVEAFNSRMWDLDSKADMSSAEAVRFAGNLATCYFNRGYERTTKDIFREVGIELPEARLEIARRKDIEKAAQFAKFQEEKKTRQTVGKTTADANYVKDQERLRQLKFQQKTKTQKTKAPRKSKAPTKKAYGAGMCGKKV